MSEISLKEMQALELQILKYLKRVCDENGLRYYLAYGTLIGAVRHQGFIPWDDDIDVFMPRTDFRKLVKIVKKTPDPIYKLVCLDTCPEFTAPLAKIIDTRTRLVQNYDYYERTELGVYIDLFLLDGAGNSYQQACKVEREAYQLYVKWRKADYPLFGPGISKVHGILRWVKKTPYRVHGITRYLREMEAHNSRYSFYKTKYVAALESGNGEPKKNIWTYDTFGEGILLPFEDIQCRAPVDYDSVLRCQYGDYMKLPPKSKQITHHNYSLTWKRR